jgi:predicted RNA binding protein YcfA (HicA-like mRNA interferase family)
MSSTLDTEHSDGWEVMPLKVSEILKLIEADGWYLHNTRGSYRQYKFLAGARLPSVLG